LVASIVNALKSGRPAECSTGVQERDYLHCRDIGDAFAELTFSSISGCINIASGEATTVASIAMTLGKLAGRTDLIRLGTKPTSAVDALRVVANVTRLRNELKWHPQHDLCSGLHDTLNGSCSRVQARLGA
jgi:UDP-glucose 4-epimerase